MLTQLRNLSDEDLVHRIALKRDQDAFSILFQRYKHLVFGVGMKYLSSEALAQDAVQLVFLKLWNDAHLYQIRKFNSWIYEVSKNHCLMELRKKDPHAKMDEGFDLDSMEWEDNLHLKLKEEELLTHLNLCLRRLNQEQQSCIINFYLEEKSYQETALITGFSNKEVKSYIQNGRRNLKICLQQKMTLHH
ncbi:MAG TPA: sigma-70 family RNA polymerase sigma factor [Arachidicoccus sp.]|nr:sigma-70 family RNA polymerase sigma factor [Arachidicoccus sp.]